MNFGEENLTNEILLARQRVYAIGNRTPLQQLDGLGIHGELWTKREDLSPIRSYKWRGAYNKLAKLNDHEKSDGVVAASAGNHAQGVALGAARLGIHAKIFMPVPTPQLKRDSVKRHGGDFVEIVLAGDTFHEAAFEAEKCAKDEARTMIHPFDDMDVIAGQGTIADEIILTGQGPFDVAFLQIGGGGMAAAVSFWLKKFYPGIKIIGVEGENQASMSGALQAGNPIELDYVDVFCDGTAVRQVGNETYSICSETLDEIITVSNEEVCAGIQFLWNHGRIIPETAGAMGIAAWVKHREHFQDRKCLTVICGANMDFARLSWIVRHAGIGSATRIYYQFKILEKPGTLFQVLEIVRSRANIIEFQYGKNSHSEAFPIIGFDAHPESLEQIKNDLSSADILYRDVTGSPSVEFKMMPWNPGLMKNPVFIQVEFPERAGALSDFLKQFYHDVNISYFSYQYSGERVGRALIGFEILKDATRDLVEKWKSITPEGLRAIKVLGPDDVKDRFD